MPAIRTFSAAILLGAITLVTPLSSHAGDFDQSDFYVSVHGAYGVDLFGSDLGALLPVDVGTSGGVNARVGYRPLSWLSTELEYEWLEGLEISAFDSPIGTFQPQTVTANIKLIVPSWRIQPYAVIGGGVGFWTLDFVSRLDAFDTSGTGFAFRAGTGLDVFVTRAWAVNAEATAVLNTSGFTVAGVSGDLFYFTLSAGLAYHF